MYRCISKSVDHGRKEKPQTPATTVETQTRSKGTVETMLIKNKVWYLWRRTPPNNLTTLFSKFSKPLPPNPPVGPAFLRTNVHAHGPWLPYYILTTMSSLWVTIVRRGYRSLGSSKGLRSATRKMKCDVDNLCFE